MTRESLTTILACILALATSGCAEGDDPTPTDTATDTVVDTGSDTPTDTATDSPADTVTDMPTTCEGTETLTLELLDADDAPVADIPVALKCLDRVDQATSDADGLVTFENLDLASIPVDITWVHQGLARSYVGLGGDRTVPDPFTFHVEVAETEETDISMVGDIVHTVEDSWVLITTVGTGYELTQLDRYEVGTPPGGTDLPMFVIEYTSTGRVATPVAYQVITYDSPATDGGEGPAADLTGGSVPPTRDFTVTFDIDTESEMFNAWFPQELDTGGSNRLIEGARMVGTDADERFMFFGFTTNWSGGFSTPTITVTWIPEGLDLVTEYSPDFWITDRERNMFAVFPMQGEPDTWTTFTVNDLPDMSTFDEGTPIPFDFEIPVHFPDWTDAFMSYHIRFNDSYGALSQTRYQWVATVHPETTSFSFADLPWPTGASMDTVLPDVTLRFGVIARCYDADPYTDYVLWTDDTWAETHYAATLANSRYVMSNP